MNVVGTANVNITDAIVNISALRLMDTGTVIIKDAYAMDSAVTTLYTVPAGKVVYIYFAHLSTVYNATTGHGYGRLYISHNTTTNDLMRLYVDPNNPHAADSIAFTFLRIPEGYEIKIHAYPDTTVYGSVVIVEMPA